MSTGTSCPGREKLEDLLAMRLPAAEAASIRDHLARCAPCTIQARILAGPFPFLDPPRQQGDLGWLDGYRVIRVLGEGGMAIVFEAEDDALHRRVSLKVLRREITDASTRERFLREARLLAGLPHEHIVTIFQVGEANGVPYLTMELLEGQTLEARLKRDRWLSVGETLSLTREALEGLIVAHEAGLVHRDIKPANLWLETRNGRFLRVKLIDFGIARMIAMNSQLTAPGVILGTPTYMAPEQAAGLPVDGRADLYSLGCVMYRMLTGETPFDVMAPETMAVLESAARGELMRISKVMPHLPRPVAALIQSLLSREPKGRPASAAVLLDQIRKLEEDLAAGPVTMPSPVTKPEPQRLRGGNRVGIFLGVVAIIAALVVGAVAAYYKLLPQEPPDNSEGTRPVLSDMRIAHWESSR